MCINCKIVFILIENRIKSKYRILILKKPTCNTFFSSSVSATKGLTKDDPWLIGSRTTMTNVASVTWTHSPFLNWCSSNVDSTDDFPTQVTWPHIFMSSLALMRRVMSMRSTKAVTMEKGDWTEDWNWIIYKLIMPIFLQSKFDFIHNIDYSVIKSIFFDTLGWRPTSQ